MVALRSARDEYARVLANSVSRRLQNVVSRYPDLHRYVIDLEVEATRGLPLLHDVES